MYITDEEKYPVYVCRSGMGPYHIGYTEKRCQYYICIVPSRKELKVVEQYEVLINEGKVVKLIWKKWRKYEHIPHHAVVAIDMYLLDVKKSTMNMVTHTI